MGSNHIVSFPTNGDPFQDFLGTEYSGVVHHFILLRMPWDCAACPRLHRLAVLPEGTVGNKLSISGSIVR